MQDLSSLKAGRKSFPALRGPRIGERNRWDAPDKPAAVSFRNDDGFEVERFLIPAGIENTRSRVTRLVAGKVRRLYLHRHQLDRPRREGDVVLLPALPELLQPRRNYSSRNTAELERELSRRRSDWMAAYCRLLLVLVHSADHATGFVHDPKHPGRKRTVGVGMLADRVRVSERCLSDHLAAMRFAGVIDYERAIRTREDGQIRTAIPHIRRINWTRLANMLASGPLEEAIMLAKQRKDAAAAVAAAAADAERAARLRDVMISMREHVRRRQHAAAAMSASALEAAIAAYNALPSELRDALEEEVVARNPALARGPSGWANVREAARKLFEQRKAAGADPPGAGGAAGRETPDGAT